MKLSLTLSQVSLVLGLGCFLGHLWPVFRPASCAAWMRGFHRNTAVGVVLMLLGSVWFEQNLQNSEISDFAAFRPFLLGESSPSEWPVVLSSGIIWPCGEWPL